MTTAATHTPDWSLLHSFLAVMTHGSLSAAATKTGVSQPSLGRHIDALEAQLGVSLFERTGRGLQPTQAALLIAPCVQSMADGANAMMLNLARAASSHLGTVRLNCTPSLAAYCLPQLLAEMRVQKPQIQIELLVTPTQSNLLQREADIALRMVRPSQQGIITKKLGDLPLIACAHRRYLDVHGTPLAPSDLLKHTLLGFDRVDDIIQGFAKQGINISPSQFSLRTDDTISYWEALRNGFGIGFIGSHIAKRDAQVQRVLPDLPLPNLPVWLSTHREVRGNANIRWVYDFLAARFMSTVV